MTLWKPHRVNEICIEMTKSEIKLPAPKAIIFDWDNTLVDTWATIHDAMNTTLSHFGNETWTLHEARQKVRKSMRDSFPTLFGKRWHEAAEIFYDRYNTIHMKRLKTLEGAEDMLRSLHSEGIYLAIVSNKLGEYLRLEAKHLGWDAYLKNLVGASDALNDKPADDPIHMALSGSGIKAGGDVWFVGDADIDLECGSNAGCIPVLIREENPNPGEFDAHPPACHVKNNKEFKELVYNSLD